MPKRKVRRPGCAAGPASPGGVGGAERWPTAETRIRGRGRSPLSCRSPAAAPRWVSRMAPEPGHFAACCKPPPPRPAAPRRLFTFPVPRGAVSPPSPGGEVAITTPAPTFLVLLPLRCRGEALQQLRLRPWPPREEFPARKLRRRGGKEAAPARGGRIPPPPLPSAPERWLRGKREEGRGKPCLKQTTPFSSPPAADPYVPTPVPIRAGPPGAGGGASRGSARRGSRAGLRGPRRPPIPGTSERAASSSGGSRRCDRLPPERETWAAGLGAMGVSLCLPCPLEAEPRPPGALRRWQKAG